MVWPLYRTKIEGALLRKGAKQGGTAEVTAFRLWNCRGGGPFVFLPERMFQMKNVQKYARNYFAPPAQQYHWSQREYITQAPRWCSVDLRDGNQALVVPMDLEKKRSFFQFLCRLGFREIEVGFPAASDTEYQFVRTLIEHNLIPDNVTIQVITPAREAIIRRTVEALAGCKKAIVHLYNPTSAAQREQVFHKSRGQIIDIALQGVRTIADCAGRMKGQIQLEYTPESFTGTEPDFALAICDAVVQEWKPTAELPVILNLASTMSLSLPHIYANQIEYMDTHLRDRDKVILSLHPHNDRGSAIAEAELGMLAGGQRVEGTLFGNGERTGNVDLITLALNLYSHGVDPGLDLSNLPQVAQMYEESTGMSVSPRHPYGGQLVFAAFSGSHQDAIAKGLTWRTQHPNAHWNVPYLPLDPEDVGRSYEDDVIRINSQSGKGGIGYLMEHRYGINMPKEMREEFGYIVKGISDHQNRELSSDEVHQIFTDTYVNLSAPIQLDDFYFMHKKVYHTTVSLTVNGEQFELTGRGNGRFDAVSNALRKGLNIRFHDIVYQEHSLERGSTSRAIAYVGITADSGKTFWGSGVHTDIASASIYALFSAVNRLLSF